MVGISLCYTEGFAYYIPINHKDLFDQRVLIEQIPEQKVLKAIDSICSNPSILKVGQNIKFDIRILNKYGIRFEWSKNANW